jgi:hypothetical protein
MRPPVSESDYAALRTAAIAEAEAALARSPTATGATILVPRGDGSVEEVYVPKRRSGSSTRRPS